MENVTNQSFNDQAILDDALISQKFLTDDYNEFACECANVQLRNEFMNILNEEHQIQADVFDEMKKRGWYPTPQAQQQKIQQAKHKFRNANPQS